MAFPIVISSVLFLLSLCFLFLLSTRNDKQKLPPGPAKLPIVGNLHQFGVLPHRSLYTLSQIHGSLMYLKLGSIPSVVSSSANTAKDFLKTHDLDCCSRPLLTSLDRLSCGSCDIALAPYGEQWRELRKLFTVHLFSSKKVASFRPIREEEVARMINSISFQCPEINLSGHGSSCPFRTILHVELLLGKDTTVKGVKGEDF